MSGGSGTTLAQAAVRQACSTGNLYNYYDPAAPVNVTTATLTTSSGAANTANPAGILDYAPITNAYKELTAFTIANEGANTRGAATPILYNLKITQNGLLSLSYSTGGAYSYVIQNQSITTANGPLPATFRFGFAGSTGGDTNVHEIMCFKAASAASSGSSATVNEKQAAKVQAGTQAYFAYYNPNDWTGSLTANNLIDTARCGRVVTTANWDAQLRADRRCRRRHRGRWRMRRPAVAGLTNSTPAPALESYSPGTASSGVPFEWAQPERALSKRLLDDENNTADSIATSQYRLNYLRGDRTDEITTTGIGLVSARAHRHPGDIVDSSPSWVGPPHLPYTATWSDHLHRYSHDAGESGHAELPSVHHAPSRPGPMWCMSAPTTACCTASVPAVSTPVPATTSSTATTRNDGQEVLAYVPGSVLHSPGARAAGAAHRWPTTGTMVQNIHGCDAVCRPDPAA